MSESLLRAVKLFVVVGGVLIIAGTATLITMLVKRGTRTADAPPPAATAASAMIPAGGEITSATMAGRDLVLLGRAPTGQFVLVVDPASGARRRLLWLTPEAP